MERFDRLFLLDAEFFCSRNFFKKYKVFLSIKFTNDFIRGFYIFFSITDISVGSYLKAKKSTLYFKMVG